MVVETFRKISRSQGDVYGSDVSPKPVDMHEEARRKGGGREG